MPGARSPAPCPARPAAAAALVPGTCPARDLPRKWRLHPSHPVLGPQHAGMLHLASSARVLSPKGLGTPQELQEGQQREAKRTSGAANPTGTSCYRTGPRLSPSRALPLHQPCGRGACAQPSSFLSQPFPSSCRCRSPARAIQHGHGTLPGRVEAVERALGSPKRTPNLLLPASWDQHGGSSRSCR